MIVVVPVPAEPDELTGVRAPADPMENN